MTSNAPVEHQAASNKDCMYDGHGNGHLRQRPGEQAKRVAQSAGVHGNDDPSGFVNNTVSISHDGPAEFSRRHGHKDTPPGYETTRDASMASPVTWNPAFVTHPTASASAQHKEPPGPTLESVGVFAAVKSQVPVRDSVGVVDDMGDRKLPATPHPPFSRYDPSVGDNDNDADYDSHVSTNGRLYTNTLEGTAHKLPQSSSSVSSISSSAVASMPPKERPDDHPGQQRLSFRNPSRNSNGSVYRHDTPNAFVTDNPNDELDLTAIPVHTGESLQTVPHGTAYVQSFSHSSHRSLAVYPHIHTHLALVGRQSSPSRSLMGRYGSSSTTGIHETDGSLTPRTPHAHENMCILQGDERGLVTDSLILTPNLNETGVGKNKRGSLKRHHETEDDLAALSPPAPPNGPKSSHDMRLCKRKSSMFVTPAPKPDPVPLGTGAAIVTPEENGDPCYVDTSFIGHPKSVYDGASIANDGDHVSVTSIQQRWEDVMIHVGILGDDTSHAGLDGPAASLTSEDIRTILGRQESVKLYRSGALSTTSSYRTPLPDTLVDDYEDGGDVPDLIPEDNTCQHQSVHHQGGVYGQLDYENHVVINPEGGVDDDLKGRFPSYTPVMRAIVDVVDEDDDDEEEDEPFNAIAIGYPVELDNDDNGVDDGMDHDEDVYAVGPANDGHEHGNWTSANRSWDDAIADLSTVECVEASQLTRERSVEEITQEAGSRVVALNIAQHEYEVRRERKKADHIGDEEAGEDDAALMMAVVRRRSSRTSTLRRISKNLEGSGVFECAYGSSGEFSAGTAGSNNNNNPNTNQEGSVMISSHDMETLARSVGLMGESSSGSGIDALSESARRIRALLVETGTESDATGSEGDDLEAQVGIPVYPGAVAMIGIDARDGRQVSGYDSGYDDEADGRSVTDRLPTTEEEPIEPFVDEESPSLMVQGVVAELHPEDETHIVVEARNIDTQQGDEEDDKPVIFQFLRSRFFITLLVLTAAILAAVITMPFVRPGLL